MPTSLCSTPSHSLRVNGMEGSRMTDVQVAHRAVRVGRLGTAAAWISAAACLPYLTLKVLWTLDLPVGVTDRSQLHSNEWVAGNAVMAVVQLAAVALVLALVRPWSARVPTWLLLFPVWVGTGLLFQVVVGSALVGLSSTTSQGSGMDTGGIAPWVYVVVYTSFAVQGAALAIAFTCHVRARWGRLLGERTGDILASPIPRVRPWPERHLGALAQMVAVLALVVALVFAYWAAGGSMGLSEVRPHDAFGMQASRAVGAVIAAAGLLGLAGSWGRERPFWLPAALTWIGSGAMVAFDLLTVVVNRLFSIFGTSLPDADWAPIDTALMLKLVIGMLAALVGVFAGAVAANNHRVPARSPRKSPTDRIPAERTAGARRSSSGGGGTCR
jgi:hypothetical protein